MRTDLSFSFLSAASIKSLEEPGLTLVKGLEIILSVVERLNVILGEVGQLFQHKINNDLQNLKEMLLQFFQHRKQNKVCQTYNMSFVKKTVFALTKKYPGVCGRDLTYFSN